VTERQHPASARLSSAATVPSGRAREPRASTSTAPVAASPRSGSPRNTPRRSPGRRLPLKGELPGPNASLGKFQPRQGVGWVGSSQVFLPVGRAVVVGIGLAVGVVISLFQALTQIQEQTVAFVPKIIVMLLVLSVSLPWLIAQMMQYTNDLIAETVRLRPDRFQGFATLATPDPRAAARELMIAAVSREFCGYSGPERVGKTCPADTRALRLAGAVSTSGSELTSGSNCGGRSWLNLTRLGSSIGAKPSWTGLSLPRKRGLLRRKNTQR